MIEVADRVRFKEDGLPNESIDPPTTGEGETLSWQEYFGGMPGVVDTTDQITNMVRVRGLDVNGNQFTVWIAPEHLIVTKAAMDFSEGQDGTRV